MRQARVVELVESFSLAPLDRIVARFEQAYEPAFAANLHVFDDVWPLLETAGLAGVPLGLLTNSSSHYTTLKLEATGLAGAFAVVATRDTLGFGKPDERAFHHACRLLGSAPATTVYVGDHLEVDAIGATRAGLRAIWLHRGGDEPFVAYLTGTSGLTDVPDVRDVPERSTASEVTDVLGVPGVPGVPGVSREDAAAPVQDARAQGIPVVHSLSQVAALLTRGALMAPWPGPQANPS
jgi:putative hydrolase of the HAD superfamily